MSEGIMCCVIFVFRVSKYSVCSLFNGGQLNVLLVGGSSSQYFRHYTEALHRILHYLPADADHLSRLYIHGQQGDRSV